MHRGRGPLSGGGDRNDGEDADGGADDATEDEEEGVDVRLDLFFHKFRFGRDGDAQQ